MRRNIRVPCTFAPLATREDIPAAAPRNVRTISGCAKPSATDEAAFNRAADKSARSTARLLDSLVTSARPKAARQNWRMPTNGRCHGSADPRG